MLSAADVTFDALSPDGAHTTLAYWIGPCDVAALAGITADGITHAMSYQYEIEQQADRTGRVLVGDADWRAHFTPVAPVQLARAWSPLPAAIDVLGPPGWASVALDTPGTRAAAACAWRPSVAHPPAPAARSGEPDAERFRRLLAVALIRAAERDRGVLVAARPGWSYDDAGPVSATTRRLMESVGFVVQDRRPA